MTLTMNYTYRLDPDAAQQELMLSWLETCRRLYNRCLRVLKDWMNSRKCLVDRCSIDREYMMSPDIPFPGNRSQKRQLTSVEEEGTRSQSSAFTGDTRCCQKTA